LISAIQANYSISQALAGSFIYANVSFYGCTFASWQDTWYTGHGAHSYAVDSIIYGQTDCEPCGFDSFGLHLLTL
jgi:hypothetical protein